MKNLCLLLLSVRIEAVATTDENQGVKEIQLYSLLLNNPLNTKRHDAYEF